MIYDRTNKETNVDNYFIYILTVGPSVARGKKNFKKRKLEKKFSNLFLAYNTPRPPMSVHKKFSPIGPAVWPAIAGTYLYVCLVSLYR